MCIKLTLQRDYYYYLRALTVQKQVTALCCMLTCQHTDIKYAD